MQQTSKAGTGFLDAGAAALPGGWPDDAMAGSGRTPAGREVGAEWENVDDRDAEGGGQVAGAGVRADKDAHLLDQGGGFTQGAGAGEVGDVRRRAGIIGGCSINCVLLG